MGFNIAIDGPAGAGKSTIARRTAQELSFIYVDTGALYRALAVFLVDEGVSPEDTEKVKEAVKSVKVSIAYENGEQQVLVNGKNVTDRLRAESVGNMASTISAIPAVRAALLDLQRDLAKAHDVLMDGRDIGTNVLPDAELKIYLTASVETRTERRYRDLQEKGVEKPLSEIKKEIEERDHRDMTRAIAPLKQAEDAVYLDTSHMNIDEVVEAIRKLYRERKKA
ncbi:(d)CMP kinase [Blautia sp. OF03-15BH]|uniref:(d)CMP kinase n=1 Tax=Blautia sp. OF03-15BH TaxID=2292287 RepID=UPI000E4BDE00|nr:(d)CMP kinase [Blautia sp. OF03-15BH]RGY01665.1 (d)CMP kinase [Blautia sp. OF03-15BH]